MYTLPVFFYAVKETIEYEAFVQFYSKLIAVFHDKSYIPHFVPTKIISPNDVDQVSNLSDSDRAICLLKNISAPLKCGEKQNFYYMLEVIQVYGNLQAQELAENITAFVKRMDKNENMIKIDKNENIPTLAEGILACILMKYAFNFSY